MMTPGNPQRSKTEKTTPGHGANSHEEINNRQDESAQNKNERIGSPRETIVKKTKSPGKYSYLRSSLAINQMKCDSGTVSL